MSIKRNVTFNVIEHLLVYRPCFKSVDDRYKSYVTITSLRVKILRMLDLSLDWDWTNKPGMTSLLHLQL